MNDDKILTALALTVFFGAIFCVLGLGYAVAHFILQAW